jgi:hypothetical protein
MSDPFVLTFLSCELLLIIDIFILQYRGHIPWLLGRMDDLLRIFILLTGCRLIPRVGHSEVDVIGV